MKTTTTIKHGLLALMIALSIASCNKDKKDPEPAPPTEVKAITLTDLKALSTSSANVKVPDAKKITGIVISDVSGKNIDSKSIVLQEAAGQTGIIIGFDETPAFATGDQVEINISNQTLAQVNGEIVLQTIPMANAKKTGTGDITAKATTAAEITTNKTAWDGTLVTVAATELTGSDGKYAGILTIKDTSGTLTSIVTPGAAFENTAYPVSVSSITGIVRFSGNDTRIDIRKTTDIMQGAITRYVTEDFSTLTPIGVTVDEKGFNTGAGEWSTLRIPTVGYAKALASITGKDVTADADFTTAGRAYVYLYNSANINFFTNGLPCSFNNLEGLKTVSVTFAMTKTTSFDYAPWGTFAVDAFDAGNDYIQLAILPGFNPANSAEETAENKFIAYSPKTTVTGQFSTYTWVVPTQAALEAAGVNSTIAANFLKNPTFNIINLSKTEGVNGNLMLFDKVVFGYGN